MFTTPIVKAFKGLVGDVLNLDTGSTFRQPHGTGRDTELVNFITDNPDHFCKECKTGICKNCGREMHKRDLELGQDMSKKTLNNTRSEVVSNMAPNEYEEFVNGRFEPLDKLPWFRKCRDSVTCEAYKHSKIQKNSYRIFANTSTGQPGIPGKYTYYDNVSRTPPEYNRKVDRQKLPLECNRCGANITGKFNVKNRHPFWGNVCRDCGDVLKDSER